MDFGSLIDLEEKALNETEDAYRFTGYAAVFNNKDLGDDVILPGAFKKSLAEQGMPLLLFNHKMDELPIGVIEAADEDRKGLLVEGELPKDDPVARRVGVMLKARKSGHRALKGMSIGYRAEKHERKSGVRYISQMRLFEASFVNLPMNPLAGVETIKSMGLTVDEFKSLSDREREAHLRSLGLSDGWSKYLTKCTREAGTSQKSTTQREAGHLSLDDLGLADLSAHLQSTLKRI